MATGRSPRSGLAPTCMLAAALGALLGAFAALAVLPTGHVDAAFGLAIVALLLTVGGTAGLAWLMLFDCLDREFPREGDRLANLGLIALLVPWGPVAYYFRTYRRR